MEAKESRRETYAKRQVLSGLDVLKREGFARLKGRAVGLVTNHSGIDREGNHIIDLVSANPEVQLVALFSPEHGIRGTEDTKVESGKDPKTGLTIHSLYGKTHRPTDEMLQGVQVLVFDIQDIGARFYTYISTLACCMEAAKPKGIKVVVLDRPNPISGAWFDGPIQDSEKLGKFTSYFPMPTAHGMTIGELAVMFNTTYGIGCDLEVIKMEGWQRDMYFDECGLPWVNPSPNMRSLDEEILYTMVGQTEAANVSVGRGTDRPFEYVGAPWVDGPKLVENLRARNLPGVWVMPMTFSPYLNDITGKKYPLKYPFAGEQANGVRVVVNQRWQLNPVLAGTHLLQALYQNNPKTYTIDKLDGLVGAKWVLEDVKAGVAPEEIRSKWRATPEFKAFEAAREKALLYE